MPPPPLVSIIIPTYKRSVFLDRALASVYAQTYTNWEIIVVDDNDDCSSYREETETVVSAYRDDPRVRYIKHRENRGAATARNTGIRETRGEFVAFLDDDDQWLPEKLARQVEALLQAPPSTVLSYTAFTRVFSSKVSKTVRQGPPDDLLRRLLVKNIIATTSTVLCRRQVLLQVDMFDESLPAREDYDLFFRLAERFSFSYIDMPLVLLQTHAHDNLDRNLTAKTAAYDALYNKHRELLEELPAIHLERLRLDFRRLMGVGLVEAARERIVWMHRLSTSDLEIVFYRLLVRMHPTSLRLLVRFWRLGRTMMHHSKRGAFWSGKKMTVE